MPGFRVTGLNGDRTNFSMMPTMRLSRQNPPVDRSPTSWWNVAAAATVSSELPELGDSSSAVVSLEMEQEIGKQLLRQVHAEVPTISDPLLKYYTETQLYSLAEHSELKRKQLFPVLIDAQEVNAFAAPGGVVGINLGLYLTAEDVNEYSAVLAHELAHLSQRHFARQIEMQQQSALPYLAAMLASIVIAATTGGHAGMAAMSGTQALAQQNQLQFSREREAEADRIGINTLAAADLDPAAMAKNVRADAARLPLQPPAAGISADTPGDRNAHLVRARQSRRISRRSCIRIPKSSR